MLSVSPETEDALNEGRVRVLAFFDFEFTPMRVHDGDETIKWEGHEWEGVGAVLRTLKPDDTPLISISSQCDNTRAASLPLTDVIRDVLANDYYSERRMELFLCSLDAHGEVIERFGRASGTIAAMHIDIENSIVTFIARDDRLDSIEAKDARHSERVKNVRGRFSKKFMRPEVRGVPGWIMKLVVVTVWSGADLIMPVLHALFGQSNRRLLKQRLQARKRIYWATTEPSIPWKFKRKRGYAIRADTLAEAKHALCKEVARKAWWFPRGCLKIIVRVDGRWIGFIDVDHFRKEIDPERWKATDPVRKWGRND